MKKFILSKVIPVAIILAIVTALEYHFGISAVVKVFVSLYVYERIMGDI